VDVTEQQRVAERERQLIAEAVEATTKFRTVFDQSSIFAGIMSLEGAVMDANRLYLEACGYRAEEVLGRLFWETPWWRMNPDIQAKIRDATIQAAQGQPYREELPYHWADGTERVVEFALHPIRDTHGKIIFLQLTGFDVTERKHAEEELHNIRADLEKRVWQRTAELNQANQNLRDLSARLLHIRDQEARRLARELHDSVGQLVAAISMNLAKIRSQARKLDDSGIRAIAENEDLVRQISDEIRTMSHLLHPPLLDELGLASALRWYVEGFSERSQIEIALELPSGLGRLPTELETAIFRITQECLTNIHRHSGSKTAAIRLSIEDGNLILVAQDSGKGIPTDKLRQTGDGPVGVGFRGMVERLRYLGGHLTIHSDTQGTVVTATLPFDQASTTPDAASK
jgi:PAS domain S-box-containing protein